MTSFKRGLFKNILISGGYLYLSQGISFLSSIVLARILTPKDYGILGLITVFTGFILVFSDSGLSYALIRSDFGRLYQRVLTNLSWFIGIILFLLTAILAYPIALFYNNLDLIFPTIVLGTTFIFKSLSLAQGAILSKELDFGYTGRVTLLCTIVTVILTITFAYLGFSFWSLIIPQIVSSILSAMIYENRVKLGYKLYSYAHNVVVFRHTKKLISNIIGFNAINYWSRNADNMIVGKWYGSEQLGIYNRAYSLLTLPLGLITGIFSKILFPSLKKLKSTGLGVEEEYYFVLKTITFLSFPIMGIFILIPNELVLFLWGKNWLGVATLLPYFGLLLFTQTLLSTVGQLLVLQGKERQFMISGYVSAVFIVSAIVYGGFTSLVNIAAYYSFSYIFFVLLFNVFYIYIGALKFNRHRAYIFWFPKIVLSLLLWYSIYANLSSYLKLLIIVALLGYLIFDFRKELKQLFFKGKMKG